MSEEQNYRDDLYSKAVRAGKRTYFFDVRTTRGNDLYLTITESKRRFGDEGKVYYEKHKLFLYKEDFEKFEDGLADAINKIKSLQQTGEYNTETHGEASASNEDHSQEEESDSDDKKKESEEFTDIKFEDLEND